MINLIPEIIIKTVEKISPFLAEQLIGKNSQFVGGLLSSIMGVSMTEPEKLADKILNHPESPQKLSELELQLKDLHDARKHAASESGTSKITRLALVIIAHIALVVNMFMFIKVTNQIVLNILSVLFVFLVWDIRQIYKFYFGNSGDLPNIPFLNKK